MPGRGTPKVTLRVPEDVWREFGQAAAAVGMDRAALLRQFIQWYIRQPEAKIPKRPDLA